MRKSHECTATSSYTENPPADTTGEYELALDIENTLTTVRLHLLLLCICSTRAAH